MTGVGGIAGSGSSSSHLDQFERLEEVAHQLEGVFLAQLLRAMRETVHEEDGILGATPEHDTYSSMLDDTIAQIAAQKLHGGLGDALYNQLSRHLTDSTGQDRE